MKQITEALGLDSSNARKYALSKGFKFMRTRTIESKRQVTLCLSEDDFNKLVALRQQDGYILSTDEKPPVLIGNSGYGWFYIIQLLPNELPCRIKLGYTSNWEQRITSHRTTCPELKVLKRYPAKEKWEAAIIDILLINCKIIGIEVVDVTDIEQFLIKADSIMSLFPDLNVPHVDKKQVKNIVSDVKIISNGETKKISI